MSKLPNDKIQTGLTLINMIFIAFIWYGDRNAKQSSDDSTQTQQIIALNQKFEQWTQFFDKRLDRIEIKLDNQGK